MGCLAADETREVSIGWRRAGTGVLEVLGVLPRCGCALIEPLPPRLEAGATGTLEVRLAGLRRPGPFRVRIDVVWRQEDGATARTQLALRGYVDVPAVLRPPRVALGRVSAGRVVERHLQLEVAETLADHPVQVALEGVGGEVRAVRGLQGSSRGPTLVVRVRTPRAPGPFEARVVARVGGWGPLVAVVSGEVAVPEAGVAPTR